MTADYEAIRAHQHSVAAVIPLLEAIRSVAEIAFRRAEARLLPLAGYADRIEAQLAALPRRRDIEETVSAKQPERNLLVVISSERGLCGAFNQHLVISVRAELRTRRAAGDSVDLVCLGRQGHRLLQVAREPVVQWSHLPSFALPSYLDVEKSAIDILDLMEERRCRALILMHNAPQQRFQSHVVTRQLFPVDRSFAPRAPALLPIKPPADTENLTTQLIAEMVLIGLYRAVVQSAMSEELARVAAMRLATDNARHLLESLTRAANQARQASETNALLEIINGFKTASLQQGLSEG